MGTIFNNDLSSGTTRDDGKCLVRASHNPSTLKPFTNEAAVVAYIETVRGNDLFWSEPIDASYLKQLSPIAFKMQFTVPEALAIEDAIEYAGTDAGPVAIKRFVKHWWGIVEDPRLTIVDLALPATQAALGYLVTAGILTEERKEEILLGVPA